jgi:hypothetical protein
MTTPRRNTGSVTGGPIKVELRLPSAYEGDIKFANQIAVAYQSGVFILIVAAGMPPLAPSVGQRRTIARQGVESKILGEYAIPADKFIEAVRSFGTMIETMERDGVLVVEPGTGAG